MLKFEQKNQCAGCAVAEELPLKQGLKLNGVLTYHKVTYEND